VIDGGSFGALIGIDQALNIYFGKPWADRWIALANRGKIFSGRTPINCMLRHGQPGMVQVRHLLDARRALLITLPLQRDVCRPHFGI